MKKLLLALICISFLSTDLLAQYKYTVVTTIESIIPMGLGRSRIVMPKQELNYEKITMERIDGKLDKTKKVKREDARIGNFEETKILNLFSGVGISFENIASNDAAISAKLSIMSAQGWELVNSMMGVESDSGKDDGKGIFITKYIFRKNI